MKKNTKGHVEQEQGGLKIHTITGNPNQPLVCAYAYSTNSPAPQFKKWLLICIAFSPLNISGASLSLKVPDSGNKDMNKHPIHMKCLLFHSENKLVSEVSLSNSNPSSRTSIISTSSASYSCGGNDNVFCILKALNDISYLYKAKVKQNYQWSSFSHGELSLKVKRTIYNNNMPRHFPAQVGDIVYVTQENDDEMCMGIVDLSYGQFPKYILQQLNSVSYFSGE